MEKGINTYKWGVIFKWPQYIFSAWKQNSLNLVYCHTSCHKIKFKFIYNSCITLLIRMYIVLLLFNFAHHFTGTGFCLWDLTIDGGSRVYQTEVAGLVSNYIGIAPVMFIMVSKVLLHLGNYRQLWVTVCSCSYFQWTVLTVSLNFKIFLSPLKINKLKQKRAETI